MSIPDHRSREASPPLRVAVAGLGAIGKVIAERIVHSLPACRLTAVAARDPVRARSFLAGLHCDARVVTHLPELVEAADLIVEALPAGAAAELAEAALERGRILLPLSVAVLIRQPALLALARRSGARIIVPSGALLGLDAVRAGAEGRIDSVRLITRKPPDGLRDAPHLLASRIVLGGLSAPLKVFEGNALEAAAGFPANVNVVAALSLAGVGPERTRVEIWADPGVARNQHRVEVVADSASFSMEMASLPSADNPRTSRIAALSAVAALRRHLSAVQIGS